MTDEQFKLVLLAEESAEVAERASKCIRFGMDEVMEGQPFTNRERLEQELGDLYGVMEMLKLKPNSAYALKKAEQVYFWMQKSKKLGQV